MAVADVADSGVHGRARDLAPQRLGRRMEAGAVAPADDDGVAGRQVPTRQREAEAPAAARDHDAEAAATVLRLRSSPGEHRQAVDPHTESSIDFIAAGRIPLPMRKAVLQLRPAVTRTAAAEARSSLLMIARGTNSAPRIRSLL